MSGFDKSEARDGDRTLKTLILKDQLSAVCRNVLTAASVNIIISSIVLFVSIYHGHTGLGVAWFSAATTINMIRIGQCLLPPLSITTNILVVGRETVERQLKLLCLTALVSGLVWALIPVLCDGYTSPQTLFYLTVVCGITAGAVTHGTPYALMPTCMISPPLISLFFCLLYAGGVDRDCLAATVFIYAVSLIRFAWQSEAAFRDASLSKNKATNLTQSLSEAQAHALIVAEKMTCRAKHDELTGLLNRTGFMDEVNKRINDRCSTFCLMLLDLDGFKSVNDVFGHHAGDRVLIEVSRRLSESLSHEFIIGRLGGDEFAIFCKSSFEDSYISELATQLITSIEVPFATFDVGRVGACIGICIARLQNITELLTSADQALYAAKSKGRNQYYIFDDILRHRLEIRCDIERDLHRAISDNALEVWYQPVVRADGRKLVTLEALLRWNHCSHGWIPPEEVISTAAMAGLAEPLLRFIFGKVCLMIQELRSRGLEHVRVAMNISPREIARVAIDEILLSGLKDQDCPESMLEIEVTEETIMDIHSVQDKLIRLSDGGVHITLDDFGVAYATLAMLRQPHISKIKIDRSFIKDISISENNKILVQSVLHIGRSLGMQVVAEGIETSEDHQLLKSIGCDLMQGYYFQRPSPSGAIIEWLQSNEI
jgi:diguanylate cyclase (GGDEF)-like protein